ncbi:thiamin biosynthesis lipoprotein ApbE [Haloferula helveola]|uniref:FAD:protein FMN transferase n=1 Tax=Haloferula helveola TaxID=490095 RepID=A0ABN6GXP9_9BACT|nr:thiamin biosynthesis lipoprotein ApbE [Haloferula helveola]
MKAAFVFPVALLLLTACRDPERVRVLTGEAMGTTYRIKYVGDAEFDVSRIEVLCDGLDRDLSTWRDDSWVSRFNAAAAGSGHEMPDSVAELLELSSRLSEETEGRFDPTIGALVKLWGFGPNRREGWEKPTQEEVDAALGACGFRNLVIEGARVAKRNGDLMLDFSAIAKGYTVDRMADLFRDSGYRNFVVEFGGEIYASGAAPGAEGWVVGGGSLESGIVLTDEAVATSGSEHQSRGFWSHIINPRTGWALPPGEPVTVRAESCARADALATAGFVAEAEADVTRFQEERR